MTNKYSLYLHIPFCEKRCAYCDFNTYAGQGSHLPKYIEAVCRELRMTAEVASERIPLHSIYFGGGTPSLVPAALFDNLFQVIRENFDFVEPEISLEANPGTLSFGYLKDLHALGFNRISLGVQSAHPEELHFLERIHDYYDVIRSVEWINKSGFENYNLDLLFGLPGQTLKSWQDTLSRVTGLIPHHLSIYSLTIEPHTLLGRWAEKGMIPVPDPDLSADMYEWAMEFLADRGYQQYEISNWSRPGYQCRHNLQYWRNLPYLGVGAGAHGYAFGSRYSNVLQIKTYIERMNMNPGSGEILINTGRPKKGLEKIMPAIVHQIQIDQRTEMQETMMVGLRLTREGVSSRGFHERFGKSIKEVFGKEINRLIEQGLIKWKSDGEFRKGEKRSQKEGSEDMHLILTPRGRMVGNQVFQYFVGD